MEARQKTRFQWKQDAGNLIDAHHLAFSAVCAMVSRFSGRRFEPQPQSAEGQMSLTAQFIQGIDICEVSISEGLYAQAAGLLKQELETLAAVDEFKRGQRREKITPKVGRGATKAFGPIYGDLNDIAHVARHDVVRQLVTVEHGEICAPTLIPQYNRRLATFLYGYHIYFIIEMTRQVDRIFQMIFGEGLSQQENEWTSTAMLILLKEDIINLSPDGQAGFPGLASATAGICQGTHGQGDVVNAVGATPARNGSDGGGAA